jgi:hypothetical protein
MNINRAVITALLMFMLLLRPLFFDVGV